MPLANRSIAWMALKFPDLPSSWMWISAYRLRDQGCRALIGFCPCLLESNLHKKQDTRKFCQNNNTLATETKTQARLLLCRFARGLLTLPSAILGQKRNRNTVKSKSYPAELSTYFLPSYCKRVASGCPVVLELSG